MIKFKIAFTIFLFYTCIATSQVTTFKYISNNTLEISSISKLNDSYYLLLNESVFEFDQKNSFIIKLNNNLEIVDTFNINYPGYLYMKKILIQNNNILLYGICDSINNTFQNSDLLFIYIDTLGNITKHKKLTYDYKQIPNDIIENINSQYIFSASTNLNNDTKAIGIVGKIDDDFNVTKIIRDSSYDVVFFDKIKLLDDSNIAVHGQYLKPLNYGARTILYNQSLSQIFDRTDSSIYRDQLNAISKSWLSMNSTLVGNNLYTANSMHATNPYDSTDMTAYSRIGVCKLNKSGGLDEIKLIYFSNSITDRPYEIEYINNNIYIYGTKDFYSNFLEPRQNGNFLFLKLDTNLNIITEHEFGDSNYQQLRGVLREGNSYMFYGFEQDEVNNKKIPYIYKVDNIDTYTSINSNKFNHLKIYPNPSSGIINIDIKDQVIEVYLVNTIGQRINTKFENNKIDISENSPGIYILFINTNKGTYTEKIIKN